MRTRIDPTRASVTEHLISEYFGDPAAYGMRFPLPRTFFVEASKLVLAIVGADGKVSSAERAAWEASARFWGIREEELEESGELDLKDAPIDRLCTPQLRAAAGLLLYDAVRIARVDGFHDRERQLTAKAARALGLEASIVPAVEGLVSVSDVVMQARHRLLAVPPGHNGGGPLAPESVGRAVEYGSPGAAPVEILARVPEAIKIVCAGDNDVSDAELAWLVGQGRVSGLPPEAVEAMVKFDPVGKRIEDYVDERMEPYTRLILFDAIRAARVDGFRDRERETAQRAARKLGLEPTFVVAMENQIRTEDALRDARYRLLARGA